MNSIHLAKGSRIRLLARGLGPYKLFVFSITPALRDHLFNSEPYTTTGKPCRQITDRLLIQGYALILNQFMLGLILISKYARL